MSDLFFYLIIFIFGTIIGSFLNCVIYRLEIGGSFLKGRSFCPHCKHELSWQDLIPVLSFLILKGKCRYCHQKISLQYPIVELATGFLFVMILNYELRIMNYEFLNLGFILNSLFLILNSCFLIIIFVYDLKHYIIPDWIIYSAMLVIGIWYLVAWIFFNQYTSHQLLATIYSAFGAALFFFLIVLVSRGKWMGVGDIKLAFFMGFFLGWPNILVALFLAFFIGAVIGAILMILNKKTLKSEIPFGPFLVTGTFLALFLGEKLIHWYLNFALL